MSYGLGAYKKTSVQTASKEQILLMLYQAAIKNCKKAIEAVDNKNIADKGLYIGKMQDIVIELNNSLDFEVGGDVAESFHLFMITYSTQAHRPILKLKKEPLEGCLNVLNTLYDGWSQAVRSLKSEKSAQQMKKEA